MRLRCKNGGMTVNIVAGTSAVLFSIDMEENDTKDLMGFYIHKKNLTKGTEYDIDSIRYLEGTVPNPLKGGRYSTKEQPWQSFLWEDFYVEFKSKYEYSFTSVHGKSGALRFGTAVTIPLTIPSPKDDIHEVYFNRGVAGSQAYATEFKNLRPDKMEPALKKKALKWLSKGLEEALLRFIKQAKDNTCQLYCCFYEFEYAVVMEALKAAAATGADVNIIYDARKQAEKNQEAIKAATLPMKILFKRSSNPTYIQHNKFMVFLKNGKPQSVCTGSTNITEKGIFGQCNTGHIVRDADTAQKYMAYWNLLKKDPDNAATRAGSLTIQADVDSVKKDLSVFFSPRSTTKLLGVLADMIGKSKQLVCGMFPFSFNKKIKDAITADTVHLKYVIIDKKTKDTTLLSNDYDNVIIYGGVLDSPIYNWLNETNSGKLFHGGTNYIHNKVILIDPLDDHPIVIVGSANFSDNSVLKNDENILVIKDDTAVADLYFTEFSRVFNHYSTRGDIKKLTANNNAASHNPNLLWDDPKDWVPSFYNMNSLKYKRRKMFSDMTTRRPD